MVGRKMNMQDQGKTTPEGVFSQLKSLLLVVGIGLGIYLVATVAQLTLVFALLFLLFPVAATLLSFFGVHAVLKRISQCHAPRTISVVVAAVVLGSCVTFQLVTKRYTISEVLFGKTHWSKTVPKEFQGQWVEVSDIVTIGDKRADVFEIGAQLLRTIRHIPYENDPPITNQYSRLSVAQQSRTVTLHCPSELYGERVYRLSPEDSGYFIHITEVSVLGAGYDYAKDQYLGRFCRK